MFAEMDWIGTATPSGLLLLVVALILSGRLVTRSALRDVREDRDARIAEALTREKVWQEAYKSSQAALSEQGELLRDSLEGVHAIRHMLESSRDAALLHWRDRTDV